MSRIWDYKVTTQSGNLARMPFLVDNLIKVMVWLYEIRVLGVGKAGFGFVMR
jgi:hypothetical protein